LKRFFVFIIPLTLLFFSCNKSADVVVAEVYNDKLYSSEINELLPDGLTEEDSAQMASKMIDEWISRQVILHEAEKILFAKDKNFNDEIAEFRKNLLINAYYKKITADSTRFTVTDRELNSFIARYEPSDAVEREIIKLNYVKLSKNSKLIKVIRNIMFDDAKRIAGKGTIEKLCGDSIEYFIEDDTWLYLDDLSQELPVDKLDKNSFLAENKYFETSDNQYTYIIVFLDYKTRRTTIETTEEIQAARKMLIQGKKADYIQKNIDLLYKQALDNKKIIR
jgi:hypothetical protein